MGHFFAGHLLPQHFARLPVQAQNGELIDFRRFGAAAEAGRDLSLSFTRSFSRRLAPRLGVGGGGAGALLVGLRPHPLAGGDCGLDEDPVLPDDGSGLSAAGNLHLPLNVVRLAPGGGWIGRRRDAVLEWAAPLRPVLVKCRGRRSRCSKGEGTGQAKEDWQVLSFSSWSHIASEDNHLQRQKSRRVRARGLQAYTSAPVGRLPPRGARRTTGRQWLAQSKPVCGYSSWPLQHPSGRDL